MIKLLSTIPLSTMLFHCFTKGFRPTPWFRSLQLPISIDKSQFSCHLHRHQKKITTDDKVTFHYLLVPDASTDAPNDASVQSLISTVFNSPYLLRNRNQYFKIAPDTKKRKKWLMPKTLMTLMLLTMMMLMPPLVLKIIMDRQTSKNPHIHW